MKVRIILLFFFSPLLTTSQVPQNLDTTSFYGHSYDTTKIKALIESNFFHSHSNGSAPCIVSVKGFVVHKYWFKNIPINIIVILAQNKKDTLKNVYDYKIFNW